MPCRLATACSALASYMRFRALPALCGSVALLTSVGQLGAQQSPGAARVSVRVTSDQMPVEAAIVRSGAAGAQTDVRGEASLRLSAGTHSLVVSKLGYRPDSLRLTLRAGADTTVLLSLTAQIAQVEAVVVSATRSERRVEDVPLRVEVIDEEEIAEKVAMTPGDIAMMLNETSGLRVQTTSPSLGGASIRIQGLAGRYSLLLVDGLPLYGGQAGGLGLLQIPPVDLGRVEVIKGTASALYGSSALGGVVNLIARRPGTDAKQTVLLNQTTRGGTDAVAFLSAPLTSRWGYTLLAGGHRQAQRDLDADGWTDLPGYERAVVRPRFYFADGTRSAFLTAGYSGEDRQGGTLPGRMAPDGAPFAEGLQTQRVDLGALARWVVQDSARALHGAIVTLRGSAMAQQHRHQFGRVREADRHQTWFGEAAITVPRGRASYVGGVALQQDGYRATDVAGFDYTFTVPAVFGQFDVDPAPWISLSTSVRADAHSEYGTVVNPRLSVLLRRADGRLAGWSSRLSLGTGEFAPSPFTDLTETTGLSPLAPLAQLVAERALGGSVDVGGPVRLGATHLDANATLFASRVEHPVQVVDALGTTPQGAARLRLANAPQPTRTWGMELLGRFTRELGLAAGDEESPTLRVTGSYTFVSATSCDERAARGACDRRAVPLTPRHTAGVVAAVEREGKSRLGVELYYTGRQTLDDNPFRTESRPYVVLGVLGERVFPTRAGAARLFVNLENLTNVRQTRIDPLLLPARGRGGRWTTDAWTELTGFTANAGVRFGF
ncbi:MAG: TonB-dependent receptor [Gemmatimonadota bacterium]|nr:TonB-dependent receptor [Gemmatimonadota bacterium]